MEHKRLPSTLFPGWIRSVKEAPGWTALHKDALALPGLSPKHESRRSKLRYIKVGNCEG